MLFLVNENVIGVTDVYVDCTVKNKQAQFSLFFLYPLYTDTAYGEGIYFARNVTTAMELWKENNEEYLYFVEAEVLTENSTPGKRGLTLPPALETNPQMFYDSVKGGNDIAVVFSSYQALPKHIITCKLVDFSTVSSWL